MSDGNTLIPSLIDAWGKYCSSWIEKAEREETVIHFSSLLLVLKEKKVGNVR